MDRLRLSDKKYSPSVYLENNNHSRKSIFQRVLIAVIIFAELVAIFSLGVKIYLQRANVLGSSASVNPLNKDDLIFAQNEGVKYFFEPKPSTIQYDKRPWLTHIAEHSINSDSLNERFDYETTKPNDTYRIITLGDSFTYGLFVDTKDSYPEQLEDLLNSKLRCTNIKKFEVINLGVGGYDIEYSVYRFKQRGQKYNPDLVLWFIKGPDFEEINEITKLKAEAYFKQMQESGELEGYYKKGEFYPHHKLVQAELKELGEDFILDYQRKALHSIDEYYKGKIVVFTFDIVPDKYKKIMQDFAETRESIFFYDGLPNIYEMKELTFVDRHPNAKGYSLIVDKLVTYLNENKIIPCN